MLTILLTIYGVGVVFVATTLASMNHRRTPALSDCFIGLMWPIVVVLMLLAHWWYKAS